MKKRYGDVDLPFESRNNRGEKICVYCGKPLTGRKLRWCSQECVDHYLVRNDPQAMKEVVLKRDKGVCAICGLDCIQLRNIYEYSMFRAGLKKRSSGPWSTIPGSIEANPNSLFKKKFQPWLYIKLVGKYLWLTKFHRWNRDLYELDHIIPVVEGGGSCGPENIRTLCYACHKKVTAELMGKLAYERSKKEKRDK